MEHHKHLGCCPSITIDKHPCDALPILLCPFSVFLSFVGVKVQKILYPREFSLDLCGFIEKRHPILTLIRSNTESFQSSHHTCKKHTYLILGRICFDEYFLHLFASFWTDSSNPQWEIG